MKNYNFRKKEWKKKSGFKLPCLSFVKRRHCVIFSRRNILALLALSVVCFIFFSPFFMIKKISIEGNKNISSDSIENSVKEEIRKPFLGYLPGNNIFFDKNESIASALTGKFSEIKSAEMDRVFPDSIKIKIEEKDPSLIWCRLADCYFLDSEGAAFLRSDSDEIKKYEGRKFVKIIEQRTIEEELEDEKTEKQGKINDNSEEYKAEKESGEPDSGRTGEMTDSLYPLKLNDKATDRDFLDFVFAEDKALENMGIKVKYYKTKGTKTRELIAFSDKNTRFYFDATGDANLQAKNLNDFLSKAIDKEKINSLRYVYLKTEDKIFYR